MYSPERRIHDESGISSEELRAACGKCHALAVPLSWRRSPAEWKEFINAHARSRGFKPNDQVVASLAKAAPLHNPEWQPSESRPASPTLAGRWLVTASFPGRGKYYGEMQIDRAGDGEFTTRVSLTSLNDGSTISRTGRAVVYGGYAWRGRSGGSSASSPDDLASDAREVMWISPDGAYAEGRWFWGQYQEFGFDVKLQKVASQPMLLAADHQALRTGSGPTRIRLLGENLPAPVTPSQVSFGAGTTVRRIVSSTAKEIVAEVDVAADAQSGKRDVTVARTILPDAVAIYDRIDYIKVTPESAVASFGDSAHLRGYLPFEAIGYQRGADGRLHTADDVELGPVDVTWSLQVFHAPEGSSPDFVGTMNAAGLLIPAPENPGNNFDVWAIATAKNEKDRNGAALVGKSYVVVAIPEYTFNGRRYVRDLDRWIDDGPARERTQ
jgi:quinohemoprotein amine dehydrogenase